jgi:hypothetical protein
VYDAMLLPRRTDQRAGAAGQSQGAIEPANEQTV